MSARESKALVRKREAELGEVQGLPLHLITIYGHYYHIWTYNPRFCSLGEARGLLEAKEGVSSAWKEAAQGAEGKLAAAEARAVGAEREASEAKAELAAVSQDRELIQLRFNENAANERMRLVDQAVETAGREEAMAAEVKVVEERLTAEWEFRTQEAERNSVQASESLLKAEAAVDEAVVEGKEANRRGAAAMEACSLSERRTEALRIELASARRRLEVELARKDAMWEEGVSIRLSANLELDEVGFAEQIATLAKQGECATLRAEEADEASRRLAECVRQMRGELQSKSEELRKAKAELRTAHHQGHESRAEFHAQAMAHKEALAEAEATAAAVEAQCRLEKEIAVKGGEEERGRLRDRIYGLESEMGVLEEELARQQEVEREQAGAQAELREALDAMAAAKLAAEAREHHCVEATRGVAGELSSAHGVIRELGERLDQTAEWKLKVEAEAKSWQEKLSPATKTAEQRQVRRAPQVETHRRAISGGSPSPAGGRSPSPRRSSKTVWLAPKSPPKAAVVAEELTPTAAVEEAQAQAQTQDQEELKEIIKQLKSERRREVVARGEEPASEAPPTQATGVVAPRSTMGRMLLILVMFSAIRQLMGLAVGQIETAGADEL